MAASGKRDTDKCPLCGASNESNGHLKAHCPEDSVKRIRGRMVSAIAELVQNELGDSMPDPAWQAIADQWNEKSLKEAYPEEGRHSLVGIKCKNCRKGHNCRHRGKTGHLPATETADAAEDTDPEEAHDELDMVDEHVRRYITDMRKPGARTTWAGWFPNSFAQLLASFDIDAEVAHELAISIRKVITEGMDEMWRERNTAQHHPKERKEIDGLITQEFERREALGMETTPYQAAEEIHKRPHKTKKEWLTNSRKRTQEKAEANKRRADAIKAFAEGKAPKWNADADDNAQRNNNTPRTQQRATNKRPTKKTRTATAQQKTPWDPSPAAAPRESTTLARRATRAGSARAEPAAASAAAPERSTATITVPPSIDLQRRTTKRQKTLQHWMTRRSPAQDTQDSREHVEETPHIDSQSDDPDLIDDVV